MAKVDPQPETENVQGVDEDDSPSDASGLGDDEAFEQEQEGEMEEDE